MARGKRRRRSARRASSAAASGSGPSTTVTDVAMVVTGPSSREGMGTLSGFPSSTDEAQLAQARRLLDRDRILVREAGVAEPVPGSGARAVHRFVQPFQRQVAERVGADEPADLVRRARRRDQLL